MRRAQTSPPALSTPTAEEPSAGPGESDRARVLLVDDDERNLLALATVLEDLGEVVLARSGEEALRHLLKGEFAVILLDVYMPGMESGSVAGGGARTNHRLGSRSSGFVPDEYV